MKIESMSRFSQLYLQRGTPSADAARARQRVYACFSSLNSRGRLDRELSRLVESELGLDSPVKVSYHSVFYDWKRYFRDCSLRDFLDTITLVFSVISVKSEKEIWISSINRILSEENLFYYVDGEGCVHFSIDEEFQRNYATTIMALGSARYSNVRQQLERGFSELDRDPKSGKAAIRAVFASTEGLFRLIYPESHRLAGDQIEKYLAPSNQAEFGFDTTSLRASNKLIKSFKEWVEACHFYRHEPGTSEPAEPSLKLAVLLISAGAGWIRWLAEFDKHSELPSDNAGGAA